MNKPAIAIYLQHYLAPSMTFIYRQLKGVKVEFNPIVLCSNKLENLERFPFRPIYRKKRNFNYLKQSRLALKLYGHHTLLSIKPKISSAQNNYFQDKLLEHKIKLIHAHFGPSAIEILPLAKKLKLPLVVTFHGYDASSLFQFDIYRKKLESVYEYAEIITVSDYMKEVLVQDGCKSDKIYVIRCGIPVEKFQFIDRKPLKEKFQNKNPINFLQVSNFVEKKGHVYTVEAFSKFVKYYPRTQLILAGSGPLLGKVKKLVVEKGLESKVQFAGKVNEKQVLELMNEADIFLHHSVTSDEGDKEGVPTVIMEAMATGLPIISTFHSGIPELIEHGKNGLLVKEKDVDGYYHSMISILRTDHRFGLSAREKVKSEFSLEKEVEKLKILYQNIIAHNQL